MPNLSERERGYIWNDKQKQNFEAHLTSHKIKNKIEQWLHAEEFEPIKVVGEIKDTILKVAENCNLKKRGLFEINPSPPWFDNQCLKIKNDIKILGNKLKKLKGDAEVRIELLNQKRNLKKVIQRKKRLYKQTIITKMHNNERNNNQKNYWKLFNKMNTKKNQTPCNIPHETLTEYFKSTLTSKRDLIIPLDCYEKGQLDYPFTIAELNTASCILKPGKATGIDNLGNEMLACLVEKYPSLIIKLFNSILSNNKMIPSWSIGMITPIHKKGSKNDPENYRGISLLSCFGKLFTTLLYNRLLTFATKNNIISNNQLGFLPNNRTSDAHLIIHNTIQKHCHKNKGNIYSCFIDFSKAFDTIPRDTLLKKLLKYGINGKFFNILKHMYINDKACIKIGNKITEAFSINQGVRQGCIISPLLFNIFLADLPEKLDKARDEINLQSTIPSCILWADDIIMMSESEIGLKNMLSVLGGYCKENELKVNTDKTKCMIFNKTGRLIRKRFFLNNIQLETVREYKYLGFLITPSGEIKSGLKDLRDRAMKAFFNLKSVMGSSFNKDVEVTLNLVDFLIKPILLYASDFWGGLKLPKDNPIETLHYTICKQILGVQKQTTNIGVLLELGRVPFSLFALKAAVKNWERIRQSKNPELGLSYKNAINDNLIWISNIKSHLEKNGMLCFYENLYENKTPFIHKRLFRVLSDTFHQEAFHSITTITSKLRTYGILKTTIGLENYLIQIRNPEVRRSVSKFRLSNHSLNIEKGRHNGVPKEFRFCPFCPEKVETEIHFLIECPLYQTMRDQMLMTITMEKPSFAYYTQTEKFQYLLSDKNIQMTSKYLHSWLDVRMFLLRKPKRRN